MKAPIPTQIEAQARKLKRQKVLDRFDPVRGQRPWGLPAALLDSTGEVSWQDVGWESRHRCLVAGTLVRGPESRIRRPSRAHGPQGGSRQAACRLAACREEKERRRFAGQQHLRRSPASLDPMKSSEKWEMRDLLFQNEDAAEFIRQATELGLLGNPIEPLSDEICDELAARVSRVLWSKRTEGSLARLCERLEARILQFKGLKKGSG